MGEELGRGLAAGESKAMPMRWGDPVLRTPEPTEAWLWELLRKQADLNAALSQELADLKAAVTVNRGAE